jgi:hypothetical protein
MHIDTIGVPEFWASNVAEVEVAGDGLVRLIVCTNRKDENVPVYSVVMPAIGLLQSIPLMSEFCKRSLGSTGNSH